MKLSAKNRSALIKLIQNECANYVSGECAPCDLQCAQIVRFKMLNDNPKKETFACPYFRDNVLPMDKNLYALLLEPEKLVACERCGKMFAPANNKAKYCVDCAAFVQKKLKREYAAKKRSN